jgi:hypothetical protein
MKKAFLLLAVALLLIFLSDSVYTWGINHALGELSTGERVSILDTTTIRERWGVVKLVLLGLGVSLAALSGFFFYRAQDRF